MTENTVAEYNNLIEALCAIQDAVEQPKKDASNPMFKSKYVPLEAVEAAVLNAKKKVHAKVFINYELKDGVMWVIMEGYGDKREYQGAPVADNLGNRGTNAAQAEGSAETYAKRYSLSMAFMISSEVDDDGNAVQNKQNTNQSQNKPKNQLNSTFGGVAKAFREKNQLAEDAMYQAISQQFGANINNFYAFNKLNDRQKEAVINWLKQGVN